MNSPFSDTVTFVESASRRNLQRLFMLRNVMMFFLLLAALILAYLSIPLPKLPIGVTVSGMLLLNLVTWLRLKNPGNISELELLGQLLGDTAALTVLFYYTGGYSNPFVWMYLLPPTVAAVALQRIYAWLLAAVAVTCYSTLVFFYVPLSHLHMHYLEGQNLDIHLVGMWMGFVVSAGIIAFFVARIGQNLRDYDRLIATAREGALESERMMALGTLAASAAHELGTPLATMAVLTREMQLDIAHGEETADFNSKLSILGTQISRCKEILSSLSESSGKDKAGAGQALPVSEFINNTIARWRDTRPATLLDYTNLPNGGDPQIFADRTLGQALQNLLDNAADASPERITMQSEWNEKGLFLEIRDFGAGLTTEAASKAGTPFFTSKDEHGLGLGLYLTRAILARYNASLELINQAGGGVLTQVHLPLNQLEIRTRLKAQ
jgi:two-component system sensor histidine kinase RegB